MLVKRVKIMSSYWSEEAWASFFHCHPPMSGLWTVSRDWSSPQFTGGRDRVMGIRSLGLHLGLHWHVGHRRDSVWLPAVEADCLPCPFWSKKKPDGAKGL